MHGCLVNEGDSVQEVIRVTKLGKMKMSSNVCAATVRRWGLISIVMAAISAVMLTLLPVVAYAQTTSAAGNASPGEGYVWSDEVQLNANQGGPVIHNGKYHLSFRPTGSHPDAQSRDIAITRIVVSGRTSRDQVGSNYQLYKNQNETYTGISIPNGSQQATVRFFNPKDPNASPQGPRIWSGNDQLLLGFETLRGNIRNFDIQVYGSFILEAPEPPAPEVSCTSPVRPTGVTPPETGPNDNNTPYGQKQVWSNEVKLHSGWLSGSGDMLQFRPSGSYQYASNTTPDIAITRIVVRNERGCPVYGDYELIKNNNERYTDSSVVTNRNREGNPVEAEIRFFNPREDTQQPRLRIWSGNDTFKLSLATMEGNIPEDYTVDIYGSFPEWKGLPSEFSTRSTVPVCTPFTDKNALITGFSLTAANSTPWDVVGIDSYLYVEGEDPFGGNSNISLVEEPKPNSENGAEFVLKSPQVAPSNASGACVVVDVAANQTMTAGDFKVVLKHDLVEDRVVDEARVDPVNWSVPKVGNPSDGPVDTTPRCSIGTNIAIVLDASDSIWREGGVDAMAESARTVIRALEGTSSNVGIYNFGSIAPRLDNAQVEYQSTATASGMRALYTAVNNYQDRMNNLQIGDTNSTTMPGTGATNWEAALTQIRDYNDRNPGDKYETVYFVTDGYPTWSNAPNPGGAEGGSAGVVHVSDVARARDVADQVKAQGSYIQPLLVNIPKDYKEPVAKDQFAAYDDREKYRRQNNGKEPQYTYLIWGGGQDRYLREYLRQQQMDIYTATDSTALGYGFGDPLASNTEIGSSRFPQPQPDMRRPFDGAYPVLDERDWSTWAAAEKTPGEMGNAIGDSNAVVVETFEDLIKTLPRLTLADCDGSITIMKQVVDSNGEQIQDVSLEGWAFQADTLNGQFLLGPTGRTKSLTQATDASGQVTFNFETDIPDQKVDVEITESQRDGYKLMQDANGNNATCSSVDTTTGAVTELGEISNTGETGFRLVSTPGQVIRCSVSNEKLDELYSLLVRKVDASDNTVLLDDAGFAVYRASDIIDGKPAAHAEPLTLDPIAGEDGLYSTVDLLQPGVDYALFETKAPIHTIDGETTRYSILLEPVIFRLAEDETGDKLVEFATGPAGSWTSSVTFPIVEGNFTSNPNVVEFKLANVREGNLPKTGGYGPWWLAMLGLIVIACGAIFARQRAN